MLWAARPASNETGPLPVTTTATRGLPRGRQAGHEHGRGQRLDAGTPLREHESPWLAVRRRPGEAARVEDAPDDLAVERLRLVAPLVTAARDREVRVHASSVSAR